ncbi:MAG: hypothetical protein ACRC2T_18365, partial [Thermoguttaceae bacterium]
YDVVDLPEHDWDKLVGLPHLRLVIGLLKKMTEGQEEEFGDALLPMLEFTGLEEQKEWMKDILPFVAKVFSAHHLELGGEKLNQAAERVFAERTSEIMLTIFDEIELKGKAEGVAIGEARGEARKVARLLDKRFEKVPYQLNEKLLMITDLEKLDMLFDLAFDCKTLEEFQNAIK